MVAASGGNARVISVLLKAKAAVDAGDQDGWTALRVAAAKEQLDVVHLLLAAGADIEHKDNRGRVMASISTGRELAALFRPSWFDDDALAIMQEYFLRYDLDGSDTINSQKELVQLCTQLVVAYQLNLEAPKQFIQRRVVQADHLLVRGFNQSMFAEWFLHQDNFGLLESLVACRDNPEQYPRANRRIYPPTKQE